MGIWQKDHPTVEEFNSGVWGEEFESVWINKV